MAPVSNGRKNEAPDDVTVQGPDAPLAHRRPGYSLSGCTPAEPDSASPGNCNSTCRREGHNAQAILVSSRSFTSRSRAGLRLHPEVRHGALRRRWCEWEQPHYLSWCSASADDAEWMFGKSRTRLAPVLTEASSWMSDRSAQALTSVWERRLKVEPRAEARRCSSGVAAGYARPGPDPRRDDPVAGAR